MYQFCLRHLASALAVSLLTFFVGCNSNLESQIKEIRALQEANQFDASIDASRLALEKHPDDP